MMMKENLFIGVVYFISRVSRSDVTCIQSDESSEQCAAQSVDMFDSISQ
jgi:hypothetical protein